MIISLPKRKEEKLAMSSISKIDDTIENEKFCTYYVKGCRIERGI